jgi:Domain of unknown function (DUF1929)
VSLTLAACTQSETGTSVGTPTDTTLPVPEVSDLYGGEPKGTELNPQAIVTPVVVYQLSFYGGRAQALEVGSYNLPYNQAFDNDVSSIQVAEGFQLRACLDASLGGACTIYGPGNYDFVGPALNNTFSSLQVTALPLAITDPAAVVYQDFNYGGRSQPLLAGRYNLPYGAALSKDISSLKVAAGFQLKACAAPDLGGTCTVYDPGKYSSLDVVLNDSFSSLEITPYGSGSPVPVVYQNTTYGGRAQPVSAGIYNLPYGQAFDNDLSSLKVPAGFRVRACAEFDLGGPCTLYGPGNYASVGRARNDTFSSLQVLGSLTPGTNPAAANPAAVGAWSAVTPWPLIPIHAALNPDGQVMTWSSVDDDRKNGWYGDDLTQTRSRVDLWNPGAGSHLFIDEVLGSNLFCAGFTHAADGTLITAGGNIGQGLPIRSSFAYNYTTGVWKRLADMSQARWYSSATNLSNGEILAIGAYTDLPEVFDGVSWRTLTGAQEPAYNVFYPWTQAAPNGKVFYAGPHPSLSFLDTAGTGHIDYKGQRDTLIRDYGSYAMYDTGKLLVAGGNKSDASAGVIDINTDTPSVAATGSMKYGRRQHNLTLLADGQVLATGGNSNGTDLIDLNAGVYPAEVWNPTTGLWKELQPLKITRQYHSFGLLLPDGRVMVGGGGYCCDTKEAPNNASIDNPNVEYFSPPYLFDVTGAAASRPAINAAPAKLEYNVPFDVNLSSLGAGSRIAKLHLIRLGSVTHSVNMEQRLTPLAFTTQGLAAQGRTLKATSPLNANITPPGYYMLIAVNDQGVPSVARMVQVGTSTWTAGGIMNKQTAFEKTLPEGPIENPVAVRTSSTTLKVNTDLLGKQ